jgi:hypothetical protein
MFVASKALLLGLLASALALVVTLELAPRSRQPTATRQAVAPAAIDAAPATADPATLVASTLARPLFDPARRPAAGPSVAAPGVQTVPRLSGIIFGATFRRAIFQGRDGKPITAGVGDTIAGRKIERVEATQVTLSGPNGNEVLDLAGDSSAAARAAEPQGNAPMPPPASPPPDQLPPPDATQPPPPEEGPPDAPRADMPANPLASQPPADVPANGASGEVPPSGG